VYEHDGMRLLVLTVSSGSICGHPVSRTGQSGAEHPPARLTQRDRQPLAIDAISADMALI
jgi:hypothetical protein